MRALVISGVGRYALLDHNLPLAGPGDLLLAPLAVGVRPHMSVGVRPDVSVSAG